jgi:transcriptional regulator with XRE-family HTH domain
MYPNQLIKGAMAENGLTINDVKESTGLSGTTIVSVRNGNENIKLPTLAAVAAAVGLEMEIRLTPKSKETNSRPAQ